MAGTGKVRRTHAQHWPFKTCEGALSPDGPAPGVPPAAGPSRRRPLPPAPAARCGGRGPAVPLGFVTLRCVTAFRSSPRACRFLHLCTGSALDVLIGEIQPLAGLFSFQNPSYGCLLTVLVAWSRHMRQRGWLPPWCDGGDDVTSPSHHAISISKVAWYCNRMA